MTSTSLLFLPYNRENSSEHDNSQSRQKHTALEYHRKRRLSKVLPRSSAGKSVQTNRAKLPGQSTPPYSDTSPSTSTSEESDTEVPWHPQPGVLGKWRLDPFNAIRDVHVPDYVQEMLDHAIRFQWALYGASRDEVKHTQADIMGAALRSPVAFYSIVYAGACHNAWLLHTSSNASKKSILLRISYKSEALSCLRKELAQSQDPISEDLLLSINLLGVHDGGDTIMAPRKPMDPPLRLYKDNEFYSSMTWQPKHIDMVYAMVKQLGGLQALKMHGLAEALESTALNDALLTLEPPRIQMRYTAKHYVALCQARWDEKGIKLYEQMSARELRLMDGVEGKDFVLQILDDMRKLVATYDCFRRVKSHGPDLMHIIGARRSIQYDLLCRPTSDDCRYRVCRYALLIFLVETIHPKPRHIGIHQKLAERLMLALDETSVLGLGHEHPEALTWATVLGGAAASETPLYSWYLAQLSTSSTCREATTDSRDSAYRDLPSFLVPGVEHEGRCYRYWHDVCETRAMRRSAST
ncbi:hypothetical protein LTR41_004131 [Exophiala xenobiotica]|nr:hypothetical protein LTR41_004131 [Exophiala xenobiotica]